MALTILSNPLAIAAQRHLALTEGRYHTSVVRMASGSRITRASDDPAGLAISDNMTATIRSMGQAMRNAQDAISLIQIFEGGTTEIDNMLVRIRELAMHSANETLGVQERRMLDNEAQELKREITRIARTTVYADRELLAGESLHLEFQVGLNNNPERDRIVFDPGDTNLTTDGLKLSDLSIGHKEDAQNSLDLLDQALGRVNELRARIGASQNRLQSTLNSQGVFLENLSAARSRIRDTDMAEESTANAREAILRQAGVAVLSQANETPKLALSLLRGSQ